VTSEEVDEMRERISARISTASSTAADSYKPNKADWLDGRWSSIGFAEDEARRGNTGVELDALRRYRQAHHQDPEATSTPTRP
jgi:2-oxoglutarate dehydrogenase E1 component